MKRRILSILALLWTVMVTAGDVTPEKALDEASRFLQQTGKKRAVADLTVTGRVDGLYLINVKDGQGFVVVSGDDRTAPVLGYSLSGSLDPDKMPPNMRAWLQGYADEIAGLGADETPKKTRPATRASAVKKPITPLVKTRWNQDAPYNDNCPLYDGVNHAATGCVATAMAQVMYYHQYSDMKAGLPAYSTDFQGAPCIAVGALEATTFDWANMQLTYDGSETAAQNAAVAKLMQYCGASVRMSYGRESSSNTSVVFDALKNVFGYNTSARLVVRSLCTYSDWIELIYHELSEGRPVVYGGQSSGGGHEFVCDGYQGEDYFHINWGWGGLSDNYFKLSALDSDQQGIGGSSSSDGYHYGQDAVVGIQRPEDTGSVLDITFTAPNLTANSISCADAVVTGQEVAITLNITNNAAKDYSGDIRLGYNSGSGWRLLAGGVFTIPAGETRDCTINTTFNAAGTYGLAFFYPNTQGNYNSSGAVLKTVMVSDIESTSDVDLTVGLPSVEHSEQLGYYNSGNPVFNLYGTVFNGTLTIANNTADNYSGVFQIDLYDMDGYRLMGRTASAITVMAGGSTQLRINASGLESGKNYDLSCIYLKADATSGWISCGYFICNPAIITTDATGNTTYSPPADTYDVPASATSVDLTGAGVTTVNMNDNPNTLYILGADDNVPSGLTNVITGDGSGGYSAASITLTDGYSFSSPVDFTAGYVVFNYHFTRGADGTNGWNTIILPFNVTSVTADGTPIDWFHSGSDNGKQFWLKQFVGDAPGVVNFDYVSDGMEANTPYIVAFPGNHWGSEYDLSNKTIRFVGQNVDVHMNGGITSVTGGNYRFIGSTLQDATNNIYGINAAGNQFVLGNGSSPFRAYFKPGLFDASLSRLAIRGADGTTDIREAIRPSADGDDELFDLTGRRVQSPAKGIYIRHGRKVIITDFKRYSDKR